MSVTVQALRDIGMNARGIVQQSSAFLTNDGLEVYESISIRRSPIKGMIRLLRWWTHLLPAILWADVIHWHYGSNFILPLGLDLNLIHYLGKKGVIEFYGSDIRIPEVAIQDNPYLEKVLSHPANDYLISFKISRQNQERFARAGFQCLCNSPELNAYVQKDLFSSPFLGIRSRLMLKEFEPQYPNREIKNPVIGHAPSNKRVKGTESVLRTIETLKKQLDFEFRLISGETHAKTLAAMRDCDIYLDQFVIGDHGVAAVEAMAFGKPVVCYLKPSVSMAQPPDCPIINANQDNLGDVLGNLIENPSVLYEIGVKSRQYVEKYHDAHVIARQLAQIYRNLL